MSTVSSLSSSIGLWYAENKRDLPWRHTQDPYPIWLSEIILQQTRVDQGTPYWRRFMERYPAVDLLSQAPEDEVLKLWQGLGYYSRARNLLTAARQVMKEFNGEFPNTYDGLRSLKGVGDYTAAAIGSMAFGIAEPVVDGNVYRVLARLFGIATPMDSTEGRREFRLLAKKLLDSNNPGEHNQAMMELGATICKPKDPQCGSCPVSQDCVARLDGRIAELPVKVGRTKVRTRHFNYFFIPRGEGFFLRKRIGRDIWQNLYEFPLVETGKEVKSARGLSGMIPAHMKMRKRSAPVTHILSHQRIVAVFWELEMNEEAETLQDWIWVSFPDLQKYALPRLIERWLAGMEFTLAQPMADVR